MKFMIDVRNIEEEIEFNTWKEVKEYLEEFISEVEE